MTTNVDQVAEYLAYMGRFGRSMPPAWDGAGISQPVNGPGCERVGRMLPGRGLYLDTDLKRLGITKSLPYVYERSFFLKLQEMIHKQCLSVLHSEVGAITTYDAIVNARGSGQTNDWSFIKNTLTSVANQWFALFRAAGMPAAGVFLNTTAPTEAACDRATTGALSLGLSNPSGSNRKYLLTLGFTSTSTINMGLLVDIHVQGGAFRLTVTTAETVASPVAVVRQYAPSSLGAGNLIAFVATTATSATGHTLTVTYVNQAGGTSAPVFTAPATAVAADGIYPVATAPFIPLASGDFGVRSVSQTQSNTALGAGVLALILYYPLMFIPGISSNVYVERDSTLQIDALTELANSSQVIGCLSMLVNTNTTSTGAFNGFMRSCEG